MLCPEVLDEEGERFVGIKFPSTLLVHLHPWILWPNLFLGFPEVRPGFIQPWHQLGLGCIQAWLRMRPGFIQAVAGTWGWPGPLPGVGQGWGGLMERM